MNLVILDGHTANPGDLDWNAFHALAECAVYPRTTAAEIVSRARDAELVLTNKTPMGAEALAQLPKLRYIGVLATGYNVVDVAAARERGIIVSNIPGYGTRSVAQHAMALILELALQAGAHARGVAEGKWSASADWCYWDQPLVELDGLTLGIVGYGAIGKSLADLGRAFGMKILASSRTPGKTEPGAEFLALEELLARSDVVSLHCPLTEATKALINEKTLARMKPSAFLVNTSRGPLIDEPALARALKNKVIAGAALDVLSVEPPPADHPLIGVPHCLITPHQAWGSRSARVRLLKTAAENVAAFLEGKPVNVVNG